MEEQEKTRSLRRSLCSRNARPLKALVGRAQWEIIKSALKSKYLQSDALVDAHSEERLGRSQKRGGKSTGQQNGFAARRKYG